MKVGIIANTRKSGAKKTLKKLIQALETKNITPILETQTAALINSTKGVKASTFPDSCEVVAVLGGDGTMLDAANKIGPAEIPVAGINIGTLGFLTTCTDDELDIFVDAVATKSYTLIQRMQLRAM